MTVRIVVPEGSIFRETLLDTWNRLVSYWKMTLRAWENKT